ncbi:MAG TPA: polysaccharide biosynthesis/export family protein, partial [Vicinamibacteria bacterium]|nr:polysaccharide biosynthesis/export family protein [Vicinamibacteria bacterium]
SQSSSPRTIERAPNQESRLKPLSGRSQMNVNRAVTFLTCLTLWMGMAPGAFSSQSSTAFPSEVSIEPGDIEPALFFGIPRGASDEYKLGPEDVLEVTVFEMGQFDRTVRVSGDGSIDLPLIGSVRVGGFTSEQAAARVANKLGEEYVQNPQVSVFVKEFNSRRVSLLGAVDKPATYPLLGRRSLLQLLAEAGGVTPVAGKVLYVFRQANDGRRARLLIPLKELLVAGDPRWDIWLRPGDVVSVPPQEFVEISVLGAVERPGIYELPIEEASLLKALARAQWLSPRGSKSGIEIQRSGEVVGKFDLNEILSGRTTDVPLLDGDVVHVKESFF